MATYDADQASLQFAQILAQVQAGQEVILTKAGQPIARIVPVRAASPRVSDLPPPA